MKPTEKPAWLQKREKLRSQPNKNEFFVSLFDRVFEGAFQHFNSSLPAMMRLLVLASGAALAASIGAALQYSENMMVVEILPSISVGYFWALVFGFLAMLTLFWGNSSSLPLIMDIQYHFSNPKAGGLAKEQKAEIKVHVDTMKFFNYVCLACFGISAFIFVSTTGLLVYGIDEFLALAQKK
ncbi:hypothetical protein [Terasakiella sp. SH-1]|uniref:hypothetical protein n=1 Tax=Terasakiella sp. SH-1 TaxID=2560057 RepID=UPI0010744680|nr:hypothetical protein [Terasakiella sp. SH-1]